MENRGKAPLAFYHIGKVFKVIAGKGSDKRPKAVIEMWDNNILTCEIGDAKVKDSQFVIVKFDGILQSQNVFMHAVEVTDILSDSDGSAIWQQYKTFLEKSKPTHPLTG